MAAKADLAPRLAEHLRDLRLPTIRECFKEEADRARAQSLSHEAYLAELIEREVDDRRQRRVARFLAESRLPLEKNLAALRDGEAPRQGEIPGERAARGLVS
jgi:DNA replication protein DnaC